MTTVILIILAVWIMVGMVNILLGLGQAILGLLAAAAYAILGVFGTIVYGFAKLLAKLGL